MLSIIAILYREKLYEYNSMIKGTGYYLKPFHIVTKKYRGSKKTYYYYGKYWYRLSLQGSKLKWRYIGNRKPLQNLPDPPINPLIFTRVVSHGNENCLCILEYRKGDPEILLEYLKKAVVLLETNRDFNKVLLNSLQNLLL